MATTATSPHLLVSPATRQCYPPERGAWMIPAAVGGPSFGSRGAVLCGRNPDQFRHVIGSGLELRAMPFKKKAAKYALALGRFGFAEFIEDNLRLE
jgi:hypothetical protein